MRGFVRNATEAISYILAATRYNDVITLSSLTLLQSTSQSIVWELESLFRSFQRMCHDLNGMKGYFDFLDPSMTPSATPRMEPHASYRDPTGQGMKIVAKDLLFAYPDGKQILKGLNFTINPGELVAIVGGNGSGKSTLVKLLARMYDVTSGSLEINDIDIRRYDPNELWSHMSTVNQDFRSPLTPLPLTLGKYHNFSIAENIAVGNISSRDSPPAIEAAALAGGASSFITDLPRSYNTIMSSTGYYRLRSGRKAQYGLSGGQWQRIALARAFMRPEADLLLLDEPSASLDPEAEFKLFKRLKESRRGRTTVYISHRFNTVRAANRIMVVAPGAGLMQVIEKGEMVEFGTHEELMAKDGRYKYLYGLQTDALADDVETSVESSGTLTPKDGTLTEEVIVEEVVAAGEMTPKEARVDEGVASRDNVMQNDNDLMVIH
jgi:ATP-binding cassette, subfamily B, bacterial